MFSMATKWITNGPDAHTYVIYAKTVQMRALKVLPHLL